MKSPDADPSGPVALELALVDPEAKLDALRFTARYVAEKPTRVFHRLVSERYPDELQIVFTAADGTETVVDRIANSLPVATRVTEGDFVEVKPEAPVEFEFPLWGEPALEPGEYSVRARHVGGYGNYVDDGGAKVDVGAWTEPFVSNPVEYRQR